nr:hypothetical protein [Actinopolymorpha alba]
MGHFLDDLLDLLVGIGRPEQAEKRHLTGAAAFAADELATDDDAGAGPLAGDEDDDVVRIGGNPLPTFADRRKVRVVLDDDRTAEGARERRGQGQVAPAC